MFILYAALTALASLNRETGLLLVGFYWAFFGFACWRRLAFLASIWLLITIGLHLALGTAPVQFGGLAGTFEMNRQTTSSAIFANLLLLPLWIGACYYWRGSPILFKRLTMCIVPYVLAFVVGAVWQEVRLLLPLFPLALPIILREGNES